MEGHAPEEAEIIFVPLYIISIVSETVEASIGRHHIWKVGRWGTDEKLWHFVNIHRDVGQRHY